jgi:hypothetical protein
MPTKAEQAAAKQAAAEKAAEAKREAAERAAEAKRQAAEKAAEAKRQAAEKAAEAKRQKDEAAKKAAEDKANAAKAAAEKKAEQQRAANEAKAKAAADKQAAQQKAAEDKAAAAKAKADAAAQAKQAAADAKAKAAADAKAAAEKAATTYNDQGLNAAQVAQIAKLQKTANQPVMSGYMGSASNQAAIDKAKAEIAKIEAQGRVILDKQYQEEQAPLIAETMEDQKAAKAEEDQAAAQAQAARMAQVQAQQQEMAKVMAQRKAQNDAQVYQLLTQNMPSPVGYSQGPTSRQALTTTIGAGGDQGGIYGPPQQQMSPAQMAQMSQGMYAPPGMYGIAQGMPPGMPPGMGQQPRFDPTGDAGYGGMGGYGSPQQQQADTFQPQGTQPQGQQPSFAQLMAMLQARQQQAQQAPQVQPAPAPQTQQAPVMAAYGGIMRGYK